MQTIMARMLAFVTLSAFLATGAAAALSSSAGPDGVVMKGDRVQCSLQHTGTFRVTVDGVSCEFNGPRARQDRFHIVHPTKMLKAEIGLRDAEVHIARAVFAFANDARLVADIELRAGVPAVFFRSWMRNLGSDRLNRDKWAWYDWAWRHNADTFITAQGDKVVQRPMSSGGLLGFQDWLFIQHRDRHGGLGILTRHRVSSDKANALIWSRNRVLSAVFAPARTAADVQRLFAALGGVDSLPPIPEIQFRERDQAFFGKPAPEWLRRAEVFDFLYPNWASKTRWQNGKYFPLLLFADRILWPEGGKATDFVKRSHANGMRVIPYVCFSELSDLSQAKDRGHYNEWMDIQHHLDEWVCLDARGRYRVSPFGQRN